MGKKGISQPVGEKMKLNKSVKKGRGFTFSYFPRKHENFLVLSPCTHDQINYHLFEQIRTELLHTDLKFEQINMIY